MVYVELQSLNNSAEGPITKRDLFEFGEVLRRDLRKDLQQDIDEKLDDFAVIVNNSFIAQREYIDERFNVIYEKFNAIDEKFNAIDERFNHLISNMNYRFDGINNRIDDIATNYTRRDEHGKLEKRVGKLELKSA